MKINTAKTKICNRQKLDTNIIIDDVKLDNVCSFTYLGNKISDEKNTTDISCRIVQAKQVFFKKKKLFTTKSLNINIGKTLIKTMIWSVVLYGAKSWIIMKLTEGK